MKKIFALTLSLLLLLPLAGCAEDESRPREKIGGVHTEIGDVYPTDFLSFNGKSVEFDEFRYYYLNYKNMYLEEDKDYFQKDGTEEALKEEILRCLLDSWAVRFLAEDYKVKLNQEELEAIEKDIGETVDFYSGEESFNKSLAESYMSRDLYRYMMEYSSLYMKLFNTLFAEGGKMAWSDKEFYDYYQEHYVAVLQIFIPYEENESKESHDKTLSTANSVYDKAKSGEDFWELVQEYGKDDNMLDYPDGYYFTQGEAEDVLYEASVALKEGEISVPISGEAGLYIIKRMEMRELRMNENRETALFGYTDSLGQWHGGAYDTVFRELYEKKADKIKVKYGDIWKTITTETVY